MSPHHKRWTRSRRMYVREDPTLRDGLHRQRLWRALVLKSVNSQLELFIPPAEPERRWDIYTPSIHSLRNREAHRAATVHARLFLLTCYEVAEEDEEV
eukprot:9474968-Pyramimonas_sp.AAC.1